MKRVVKVASTIVIINILLFLYCIFFLSKLKIPFDIYFIIFSIVNAIILYIAFFSKTGTYKKSSYGSHGSAKWQSEREAKKNYPAGEYGFVIGSWNEEKRFKKDSDKLFIKPILDGLNNQFLIIGPPEHTKQQVFYFRMSVIYLQE